MLRYLRKFDLRESVLHIEISPWQSWQFLTALALRRANVFVTMHNAITSPAWWRNTVWRLRLQYVSRLPGFHLFTSNEDTKDKIRHLVSPRFWRSVAVTYTCVDPVQIEAVLKRDLDRDELRRRRGLDPAAFIVLCVGQFIDRKGRWIFLEAARSIGSKLENIEFVWVCPSLPTKEEQARIDSYGLKNFRLLLSGDIAVTREELLELIRIADAFALPSYVEGLPIALLEAMALGVASISTNVYAIPEAVRHMETGMLIEPGGSEELASEIVVLKNDPGLREKIARQGQALVLEKFDERAAASIAIERYSSCFE